MSMTFFGVAVAAPPANDNFADANVLSGGFAQAAGTNVEATKEVGEPNHAGITAAKSVWWVWVAPVDGPVTIAVSGVVGFTPSLGIYTGDTVQTLTSVASNWGGSPSVSFTAGVGTVYHIAVDGFASGSGTFTLTVATPPVNDALASAITLAGASVETTGYNLQATKETGEPSHAGNAGGKSVWWNWTAPASTLVYADTVGSGFNTLLAIYTGSSVDALTAVASDNDGGGNYRSALLFNAVAGTTYRIAVDGLGGVSGAITLRIGAPPPAPANDNFASATLISGATVSAEGSVFSATKETGEPNHSDLPGGCSVWWKWVAPSTGAVEVNHNGSSFSFGLLAVYTGEAIGALTPVTDNHGVGDRYYSATGFNAVAGTTYLIALDAPGGWAKLNLLPATPVDITSFATSTTQNAGINLTINVGVTGTPPFTCQWTKNGANLQNETGRILDADWHDLTILNLQEHDEGTYVLNISNLLGSDTFAGTVLTVNTPAGWPVITTQPASQTVNEGDNVSFTVAATGTEPFTYQWRRNNIDLANGGNVSGATGATLVLTGVTAAQAGNYTVLVGNGVGNVLSSPPAVLNVQTAVKSDQTITFSVVSDQTYGAVPFALGATASSGLPVSYIVASGPATVDAGTVTLTGAGPVTIVASQAGNTSYNPAPDVSRSFNVAKSPLTAKADDKSRVEGEANPALTLSYTGFVNGETAAVIDTAPDISTTATTESPVGDYPITLSGGADNNYTLVLQDGTLTVTASVGAPLITASPPSQVINAGQPASFSITVTGTGTLAYQWKHNGRVIVGATGTTLDLVNVTYADRGYYQVSVTNAGGTDTAFFHLNVSIPDVTIGAWGRSDEGQTTVPTGLGAVVTVAAGYMHSLALKPDGSVAAWGSNAYGQTDVPAGLGGVVALAAGSYHNLALKADGTVVAWGRNSSGEASVPAGLDGVVAVAAGNAHSLALKTDGTVVAWGTGTYGITTVPADLSGVTAVAAGWNHNLALKADGTVVGWGYNYYGEATVPVDLTDVRAIAAGAHFSLALKGNGTVVAWGNNTNGQTVVPAGLNGVVAIGGGTTFSLAARSDGTLLGWGNPVLGLTSAPAEFNGGIVALAAGGIHNLVLVSHAVDSAPVIAVPPAGETTVTGASTQLTVAAAGLWTSYQWQLDGADLPGATSWTLLLSNLQTSDSGTYTVIVSNSAGSVTSSGAVLTVNGPTVITPPASQTVLTGHDASFTVAATGTGTLSYQWKHNGRIIAGANAATLSLTGVGYADRGYYEVLASDAFSTIRAVCHLNISAPRSHVEIWGQYIPQPDAWSGDGVVAISAQYRHGLALQADGTVVAWGYNDFGECTVPEGLNGVVAIAAGEAHSLALKANGTVVAWGNNENGQATVPTGLKDVVAIAAGWQHSLALRADGTVVTWGAGGSAVPAGLSDVVAIAAGWMHSLALKADGTVVGWGDNQYGQNDGAAGLSEVVAIAEYEIHAMALKADGTVVAWGANPAVPAELGDVTMIAAGYDHGLALKTDGTVVAWGNNGYGQSTVPSGLTDVVAVAGGFQITAVLVQNPGPLVTAPYWSQLVRVGQPATFSASATGLGTPTYQWKRNGNAISGATTPTLGFDHVATADRGLYELVATDALGATSAYFHLETAEAYGAVVAWGANGTPGNEWANQGQIAVPAGLGDVAVIAAGDYHTLALKADGTVTAWGSDSLGQSTVPAALTGVTAIAGGSSHSLAVKADGTVVVWGNSALGPVPAGLARIVAVDAGQSYYLVLQSDGRVVTFGSATTAPAVPAGLSQVVAIAAGSRHALALKADGTVVAWGRGNEGQTNIPAGLTGVVGIAAGYNHSLALKSDGTVVGWGQGTEGQIAVPEGLNGVTAIAAGSYHSLARKADGTAVIWGWNSYRQTEAPTGLSNVAAVAGGEVHSLALFTGAPVTITLQPGARTVSAGADVVFTVAASGTPPLSYQWRRNGVNLMDSVNLTGATDPTLTINHVTSADAGNYSVVVTNLAGSVTSDAASLSVTLPASVVSAGQAVTFTAAPSGEGSTYQWSHNGRTISGANGSTLNLAGVGYADRGYYESVVTGSAGTTRSFYFLNVGIPNPAIIGWGSNYYGETSIPADLSGVVAVTSGWFHNLVLKADGTVAGWGHNGYGQTTIPADVTNAVAIAACVFKSVALRADGTVVVWGASGYGGQIALEAVPAGLRSVVAIDAGYSHCVALKADGTVTAWGDNSFGQCDVPADLSDVIAIAAGYNHNLALRGDGTVVAWGSNHSGEITVPAGLGSVVAISAGSSHNLAVKADGTVVAWGRNDYGQCSVPAGLTDVIDVMAGEVHSLALKADGTVVAWGSGSEGQTAVPTGLTGVLALAAGAQDSLAFLSGTAPAITLQPVSQSATSGDTVTLTVAATGTVPLNYQWKMAGVTLADDGKISGVSTSMLTLTDVTTAETGNYSVTISNDFGSTDSDPAIVTVSNPPAPTISVPPAGQTVLVGATVTLNVTASGTEPLSYQWRKNASPLTDGGNASGATTATLSLAGVQLADGGEYAVTVSDRFGGTVISAPATLVVGVLPTITVPQARQVVTAGQAASLTVTGAGTGTISYQWKHNGRIIAGANAATLDLANVVYADRGYYQVIITDSMGSSSTFFHLNVAIDPAAIAAWGDSGQGQVNIPAGLTNVVAIAAGYSHGVALKTDGTVTVWGSNDNGEANVPVGLSDVVAVSAAYCYSLALKSDGSVVAWGYNSSGQTDVPAGLNNVVTIAAGNSHAMAVKTDGTVVTWGYTSDAVPAGLGDVVAVAAGQVHSLALKADGTVVAWGNNTFGQTAVPAGLGNVTAVAAGYRHSLALRSDGAVVGWGENSYGQCDTPVGLGNVTAVAAGGYCSLALKADGTAVAWGDYNYGQSTVPADLNQVAAISVGNRYCLALYSGAPPAITMPPVSQTVDIAANVTFNVAASGTAPLTYQWKKGGSPLSDGGNISGAATAALTLTNVQAFDAGNYTVTVTNGIGSVTSNAATLTINKLSQTITFTALTNKVVDDPPFDLSATATSGLPVGFAVFSGPATIAGSTVTLTGIGTVTIRASQPGNEAYNAAPEVDRSFEVLAAAASFASWQQTQFTAEELLDPNVSGPNAVYGQDGLPNLLKYALGLDPKVNATTGLPSAGTTATDWVYTYTRPSDRSDITYEVEVSTNLQNWTTVDVVHEQVSVGGGQETWRARYPLASAANAFFRLKVTR